MKTILNSLFLFLIAGICEIAGGWLIWKWVRDDKPSWWGLIGGLILVVYGFIPTLQSSLFGRVYAMYGGFFIFISLLWGRKLDGNTPDLPDIISSPIANLGVVVMMWWPRSI